MRIIENIKQNLINIPGWHTNRKIVVFESDDWGSIRMPSKKVSRLLIEKGIKVDNNDNWSTDCLENKEDFTCLLNILSHYKDTHGKYPVFTMNTVMGNPDFQKIKENHFEKYVYQHFYESYKQYTGSDLRPLWEDAMSNGLIKSQFHAREHLNVRLWMEDLKKGNKETLLAFKHHFFGLVTQTSSKNQRHYLAAYRAESPEDLINIKEITVQGLQLFEKTFGFTSQSFVPCNYIFPKELEAVVLKRGVKQMQTQRAQLQPDPFNKGKITIKRRYTGRLNDLKQIYTIRNVKFEPFENKNLNWVDKSLNEIQNAFFWKKPAVVSTHRINYVGGIDTAQRNRNLKQLDLLLKKILIKWPEVEFMSSDALGNLIGTNKLINGG